MTPGRGRRNREFSGPKIQISQDVPPALAELIFDPHTSGGLLIAVPDREADALPGDLRLGGDPEAAIVGCVGELSSFVIEVI